MVFPFMITILIMIAALTLWVISIQQKLILLDESVSQAMGQIAIKLTSSLDLVASLVDMIRANAMHDCDVIDAALKLKRTYVTAKSTPNDLRHLELFLTEALDSVQKSAAKSPSLLDNQSFMKTLEAIHAYEGMVRTHRHIYNDGVTKFNREIQRFPAALIAGGLGFKNKAYIEENLDRQVE